MTPQFIWILALVFAFIVLGLALILCGSHECSESPDGTHEDAHHRSALGWSLKCVWCGRETIGVDAFKRVP
jgi:hypothetical protein